MMWIARRTIGTLTEELLLDFIVERKKIPDLVASMEDGRYGEQKFRMKRSGLKHVIYLVEGVFDREYDNTKLELAMVSTQVEGFFVHRTDSEEDTAHYLINTTKHFSESNINQTLDCITQFAYDDFSAMVDKSRNLTISDLFAKQLIQFNQCTSEKAAAVVNLFSTPKKLKCALDRQLTSNRAHLLKNIEYGNKKRKIGPALSKAICGFYTDILY
jgi:crossover junction endonuclease MUS81